MTIRYRFHSKTLKALCILWALFMVPVLTSCSPQGVNSVISVEEKGSQKVDITLEGGSGRAYIESPATITQKDGRSYVTLVWSSENYDYVIVDGIKYENENPGGRSTFTVPVDTFDEPLELIGDTTAMSKPHEIEYRIIWGTAGTEADTGQEDKGKASDGSGSQFGVRPDGFDDISIAGAKPDGKEELMHACGFDILRYGDLRLIRIYGVGDYLLVPEGADVPEDLPDGVTVLCQPLDKTYLVSTSVMDLIRQIGALDHIRLSGLEKDDWYIEEAASLMDKGSILYAGKYRAPDYELILSEGCDLAIENTMIFHDPEVKEKLEELGIPVIVETSSYEPDPLGRLEWIKLYGLLFKKEAEADDFYKEAVKRIQALIGTGDDISVAMFYVSATGMINVRVPGDYVTNMIEMAGATYVPRREDVTVRGSMGTLNMQAEDFYASAKDADILIYNATIDGEIASVDDLIAKDALFSDFKAVKEGNVYCLGSDFFQKTTGMSDFIGDMHGILEGNGNETVFLEKLGD